jgi:hypothetical protein
VAGGGGGSLTAGTTNFLCAQYDASVRKAQVFIDGSPGTQGGAMGTAMGTCTSDFVVGGLNSGDAYDGSLGPAYWWKSVVSGATITSIYNSGIALSCDDAIAIDGTMTRCWELDEDPSGGADSYKDSVTAGVSDSLSPVGTPTPTRVAGLVDRSDSGMSVAFSDAGESYFIDADWAWGTNLLATGVTVVGWVNARAHPGTNYFQAAAVYNNEGGGNTDGLSGGLTSTTTGIFNSGNCALGTRGTDVAATAAWTDIMNKWVFYTCRFNPTTAQTEVRGYGDITNSGVTYIGTGGDVESPWSPENAGMRFNKGWSYSHNAGDVNWDNVAIWYSYLSNDDLDTLYNSGAGTFYTAYLNFLWNDQVHFAWRFEPEIVRVH